MMKPRPPAECAQCGAPIPPRAHSCPGCGADERTGWRETSLYDGLDLPDSDDFASEENDRADPRETFRRQHGIAWYWFVIAVFVLAAFALAVLGLR